MKTPMRVFAQRIALSNEWLKKKQAQTYDIHKKKKKTKKGEKINISLSV